MQAAVAAVATAARASSCRHHGSDAEPPVSTTAAAIIRQPAATATAGCCCCLLQECAKRIENSDHEGAHCTGWAFDYWRCIDKCVSSLAATALPSLCIDCQLSAAQNDQHINNKHPTHVHLPCCLQHHCVSACLRPCRLTKWIGDDAFCLLLVPSCCCCCCTAGCTQAVPEAEVSWRPSSSHQQAQQ